ncbi:hypothetical protein HK098_006728 [Nowakowskiella sp. JEL0407]|nr:hypothetical protein HK098_006728 [Nowakowskiella sp. JEL0407]
MHVRIVCCVVEYATDGKNVAQAKNSGMSTKRNFSCDVCYKNKTKCSGNKPSCDRCKRLGRKCTYDRFNDPQFVPTIKSRALELENQIAVLQKMLEASKNEKAAGNSAPTESSKNNTSPAVQNTPNGSGSFALGTYPGAEQSNGLPNQADGWILPLEVVQDALQNFFTHVNSWPTRFMHERSFMSSWTRQPRELVYSLCSMGARFSPKYLMLNLREKVPGVKFYEQAEKLVNIVEPNFETLLTIIYLCIFSADIEKFKATWVYSSLITTMLPMLKLNVDPEELEKRYGHRWTVIEKDMRRRVWWSSTLVTEFNPAKLTSSVKRPLPSHVFATLPDDLCSLEGAFLFSAPPDPFNSDIERLAEDIVIIGESARQLNENAINRTPRSNIFVEAANLYSRLETWKNNLPDWMNAIVSARIVHNKQSPIPPSSALFWKAHTVHLMFQTCVLNIYRFALIDLCQLQSDSSAIPLIPYSHTSAFQHSKKAACAILSFIKDILLHFDPQAQTVSLVTVVTILYASMFAATVARFGDSPDVKDTASRDLIFLRSFCDMISKTRFSIAGTAFAVLDELKSANLDQCVKILQNYLISPLRSFEEYNTDAYGRSLNNTANVDNFPPQPNHYVDFPPPIYADGYNRNAPPIMESTPTMNNNMIAPNTLQVSFPAQSIPGRDMMNPQTLWTEFPVNSNTYIPTAITPAESISQVQSAPWNNMSGGVLPF